MRIYYDANSFVISATSLTTSVIPGKTYIEIPGYTFTSSIKDESYYLPLYKIVSNNIVAITDPIDYQVDTKLWDRYLRKLSEEIKVLLATKTNQELKDIYDASPTYKQTAIYNEIHYYWASKLPQFDMNLSLETIIRIISEYLYITVVQQQTLTTDQQTAFNGIITSLHNHNSMLKADPFDPNTEILDPLAWPQVYIPGMLDQSDYIRSQAIPQRVFVTGT